MAADATLLMPAMPMPPDAADAAARLPPAADVTPCRFTLPIAAAATPRCRHAAAHATRYAPARRRRYVCIHAVYAAEDALCAFVYR